MDCLPITINQIYMDIGRTRKLIFIYLPKRNNVVSGKRLASDSNIGTLLTPVLNRKSAIIPQVLFALDALSAYRPSLIRLSSSVCFQANPIVQHYF